MADAKKIDQISQRSGNPSRAEALNGLAYAQAVAKVEIDEALANVNEALELHDPIDKDKEHPKYNILDTRGYIRFLKGQYRERWMTWTLAIAGLHAYEAELQKKHAGGTDLPPQQRKLLDSRPRIRSGSSPRAVLYYHRALVLQALGKEAEAEADLARVRAGSAASPTSRCSNLDNGNGCDARRLLGGNGRCKPFRLAGAGIAPWPVSANCHTIRIGPLVPRS